MSEIKNISTRLKATLDAVYPNKLVRIGLLDYDAVVSCGVYEKSEYANVPHTTIIYEKFENDQEIENYIESLLQTGSNPVT